LIGGHIVHGMAVGLGNGTHGGPAGMGADGVMVIRMVQQCPQNPILLDLTTQKADIIAKAADFGGNFIGERQRGDRFIGGA